MREDPFRLAGVDPRCGVEPRLGLGVLLRSSAPRRADRPTCGRRPRSRAKTGRRQGPRGTARSSRAGRARAPSPIASARLGALNEHGADEVIADRACEEVGESRDRCGAVAVAWAMSNSASAARAVDMAGRARASARSRRLRSASTSSAVTTPGSCSTPPSAPRRPVRIARSTSRTPKAMSEAGTLTAWLTTDFSTSNSARQVEPAAVAEMGGQPVRVGLADVAAGIDVDAPARRARRRRRARGKSGSSPPGPPSAISPRDRCGSPRPCRRSIGAAPPASTAEAGAVVDMTTLHATLHSAGSIAHAACRGVKIQPRVLRFPPSRRARPRAIRRPRAAPRSARRSPASGRLELHVVGAEAADDRRIHRVGERRPVAEQERAAVTRETLAPDRLDALDVGFRLRPDLEAGEMRL